MRECDITTIKFIPESLTISKQKRFFDGEHNPMINVGSDWPDGLACKTAVNLGNPNREGKWLRNTAIIVVFDNLMHRRYLVVIVGCGVRVELGENSSRSRPSFLLDELPCTTSVPRTAISTSLSVVQ